METRKRVCGNTEERINRFMRMCLEWQYDIKQGCEKKSKYYFTKYNVGKYSKHLFDDLKNAVIDRQYAIDKMNLISSNRQKRDASLGLNSNKVVIEQIFTPYKDFSVSSKGIKLGDNAILKHVAKSKRYNSTYYMKDVSDKILIKCLKERGYIVINKKAILTENAE